MSAGFDASAFEAAVEDVAGALDIEVGAGALVALVASVVDGTGAGTAAPPQKPSNQLAMVAKSVSVHCCGQRLAFELLRAVR